MVWHDQPQLVAKQDQNPHPARRDMASYLTSWKSVEASETRHPWVKCFNIGNSTRGILPINAMNAISKLEVGFSWVDFIVGLAVS